jgi:hypothetical protein
MKAEELTIRGISDDILCLDDGIEAVSIMDMRGNMLSSATSKNSFFNKKYEVTKDIKNMAGSWAIVIFGMVQRMDEAFGKTEAVVSLHKKSKLMLVPILSHDILVCLVMHCSSNEDYIINKIQTFLEPGYDTNNDKLNSNDISI